MRTRSCNYCAWLSTIMTCSGIAVGLEISQSPAAPKNAQGLVEVRTGYRRTRLNIRKLITPSIFNHSLMMGCTRTSSLMKWCRWACSIILPLSGSDSKAWCWEAFLRLRLDFLIIFISSSRRKGFMHSNRAGLNSFRFISAICHSKFLDSARNPYINANSIVLSYYVNLHMTEFP